MDEGHGKGKVSNAAGGEAECLAVVVREAGLTEAEQVPAESGIGLRTTPVVAERAAIGQ